MENSLSLVERLDILCGFNVVQVRAIISKHKSDMFALRMLLIHEDTEDIKLKIERLYIGPKDDYVLRMNDFDSRNCMLFRDMSLPVGAIATMIDYGCALDGESVAFSYKNALPGRSSLKFSEENGWTCFKFV